MKEGGTSGYTDSELLRMQQDAIARVKEMQERARANITSQEGWQSAGSGETAPQRQSQTGEPTGSPSPQNRPAGAPSMGAPAAAGRAGPSGPAGGPDHPSPSGVLSGLLGGRHSPLGGIVESLGSDRIIIIALLLLLLGEETDPSLVLALCYLLLFD